VPEEAIKSSHEEVAETFYRIKDDLDNYLIYDNSLDSSKPTIFASKLDGIEKTHDLERLKQFYAKSGIPYYE
ncbi:Zeta toxin, partial [Planococcus sp. SIMBA_143]